MAVPVDSTADEANLLVWKRTVVGGRTALYGVAGSGLPVLFLHGWALGQHSYRRALKRLAAMGCQVLAPALPGFGGTADLPRAELSFSGYAAWADAFLTAVGIEEPVLLIGHSFGGGVAITLADDVPSRVRRLVLVNSVGGATWSGLRSMADRPLWDWGVRFPSDVFPLGRLTRLLPVMLEDAVPNAIRNPRGLWRVAQLARKADLTPQLEHLRERRIPVLALWGEDDQIIPRASFDALCAAVGTEGVVLPGSHSWLLADPDAFAAAVAGWVEAAAGARASEVAAARPAGRPPRRFRLVPPR